jgi:thiamine monophosphate kinase
MDIINMFKVRVFNMDLITNKHIKLTATALKDSPTNKNNHRSEKRSLHQLVLTRPLGRRTRGSSLTYGRRTMSTLINKKKI